MGLTISAKRSTDYFRFRHSHGGIGCGSAHKPFLASRASCSNPSRTVSPGAYTSSPHCGRSRAVGVQK